MPRMTSRVMIPLALAGLLAAPVRGQTVVDAQTHLDQATTLLKNIRTSTDTDTGKKIAALQRDFTDFATTYTLQPVTDWRTKVVVDRAAIDEMRAEIAQIKLLLQGKQKP